MKNNKIALLSYIAIKLISFYQIISPFFKPSCRFFPTCSEYAKDAFQIHGFFPGLKLTLIRILKCRPFGKSGVDLVPEKPLKGVKNGH